MELEKRNRKDEGGANAKRAKLEEDNDGVKVPPDEEVEEFFAILKRIRVAVKYFQERDGGRESVATTSSLKFETEDFEGARKETVRSGGRHRVCLDLNSDPGWDVSDLGH